MDYFRCTRNQETELNFQLDPAFKTCTGQQPIHISAQNGHTNTGKCCLKVSFCIGFVSQLILHYQDYQKSITGDLCHFELVKRSQFDEHYELKQQKFNAITCLSKF